MITIKAASLWCVIKGRYYLIVIGQSIKLTPWVIQINKSFLQTSSQLGQCIPSKHQNVPCHFKLNPRILSMPVFKSSEKSRFSTYGHGPATVRLQLRKLTNTVLAEGNIIKTNFCHTSTVFVVVNCINLEAKAWPGEEKWWVKTEQPGASLYKVNNADFSFSKSLVPCSSHGFEGL